MSLVHSLPFVIDGYTFSPMLVQMLVISTTGFPASAVNYSSGKFTSFATFCWLKVLAIVASFQQQQKKPIQKNLPQNWQIEWIKEQQVVGNGWTGGQAIFLAMDKQAIDRQTDGHFHRSGDGGKQPFILVIIEFFVPSSDPRIYTDAPLFQVQM